MAGLWTFLDISLALVGVLIIRQLYRPKVNALLPPGPKQWPLLGNLLDMPTSKEWLTFSAWGEKWGQHSSVRLYKF